MDFALNGWWRVLIPAVTSGESGDDFRSSTDPNWGTVDGGLAAAAWARQTRVYYFQGKDLVVAVQNVTGWEKPRKSGGANMIVLRSTVDEFACWECIERAKKGIPTWQNSLPF